MDDQPRANRTILSAADALSPEGLAEELAKRGILIPADFLREKAIELGACHSLGDAMFLMPEDVDIILRAGKQKPASIASEPLGSSSKEPRTPSQPDQSITAEVYTPPMLAKRWGCSERHIRNMINEGNLGCFRLGGKLIRIRHSDVEAAEKAFAQDAALPDDPSPPPKDPANEIMTRTRVNALRAKRLDR